MATPSERLLDRLRAMGIELPEGTRIRSTRAGLHQRAAGAWSWWAMGPDYQDLRLGSFLPVSELLRGRLVVTRGHRDFDRIVDLHSDKERGWGWREYIVEPERKRRGSASSGAGVPEGPPRRSTHSPTPVEK